MYMYQYLLRKPTYIPVGTSQILQNIPKSNNNQSNRPKASNVSISDLYNDLYALPKYKVANNRVHPDEGWLYQPK